VSVYRDMLKKIDGRPPAEGDKPTQTEPVSFLPALQGLEGMCADLESLSSQLEHLTDRIRSIAFCGVDTGVGVSSIALTVAQQLSDLHPGHVIFLDVNSRSQRASLIEAKSAPDSFLEYHSSSGASGIYRDGPLHLLSARGDRRALGRVKASDLAQTLSRLKEQYRWIIVDAPPAIHPECLIWGTITDGSILVVESGRTRRQAAQAVVEQLRGLNVNMIGSVLNRRRMVIPEWIYRRLFK
jgi:MinD-like ATPase involved in chromosome partitioning or flagellar assembly